MEGLMIIEIKKDIKKTMKIVIILLSCVIAVRSALPADPVISKLDGGGPRYQYVPGPDGPILVDLWLKSSDLQKTASYNPEINNQYLLFTRINRGTSQRIPLGADAVLRKSHFNGKKKTVVLIHGWRNNINSNFNVLLVAAYLDAEDVNVIVVDWSLGAAADYMVALNNVQSSATHVAKFLNWLIESSKGSISRYHIIGRCLGAHQSGIIGRQLEGKIPYLTGLDPAMPGWLNHPQAISSNVAIYTEIMHTDAGFYGITNPAGHVDFYPNGGRGMPGCGNDRNCDHHRCIYYMEESLRRGGFTGRRCANVNDALSGNCNQGGTLRMGGKTAKTGNTGIYHLITNDRSPYSRG